MNGLPLSILMATHDKGVRDIADQRVNLDGGRPVVVSR